MSQQINLYNPLFLKQEKHFSSRTMMHGLAVIVAAIAVVFVVGLVQTHSADRLAAQYRDQLAREQTQVTSLIGQTSSATRSKALESEVAQLEAQVKLRQATLRALSTGELGNTAGFSEFLAALGRQSLSGVWLTGIRIDDAGNGLSLEGRALRAELLPAYLSRLNHEPMMRGRRVTEMKLTASAGREPQGTPARFVEFSLAAPLALREPVAQGRAQ